MIADDPLVGVTILYSVVSGELKEGRDRAIGGKGEGRGESRGVPGATQR